LQESNTKTISTVKGKLRKIAKRPLKTLRGKWFWGVFVALFLILPSFILSPGALSSDNKAQQVITSQAAAANNGTPVVQYESLVFLRGVRNADSQQVRTPEVYYIGGPTEPSLASVLGGSAIMNQYPPLTTASAENVRTGIITYTVKSGDVPSTIAASFGITTNTLLWANNLSEGQYIKIGNELVILPVSGLRYKVGSGDTLSSIARKYKGDVDKMVAFNGIGGPEQIKAGDYIIIPDGEMPVVTYSRPTYAAIYSSYSKNLDGYFIHPTAGAGYRSRGIHPTNGVDIASSCWSPIYAAAEGTVIASDGYGYNGGYGKYVKIDHPNGTKTLYAHALQNLVSAGQYVKQGQLIAYMGSTGRSTGCHVHWEVYGALNPLR